MITSALDGRVLVLRLARPERRNALACDLRAGAPSARFLFSEGRLGLLPTHGGVAGR